ncbi:class I SAM-dependent methyltransferase [Amylibacter sp.]|jgi:predicted O-methyltransferase YrrM|nr:class I SAM-dependent methyltransferase [Amylibacter sp.]|tara:strand:+ start:2329 stop:3102 length:774 start_codon:yes stop_codon:yes gene_type:complete
MIEQFKTLLWFGKLPNFWRHALALAKRKFETNHDSPTLRQEARDWAASRAVSVPEALAKVGLGATSDTLECLDQTAIEAAHLRAAKSRVKMGGAGDLSLLFAASHRLGATHAIETGVAYDWSSLAILEGMKANTESHLVSVDMPYPKLKNEDFVGKVVPGYLRKVWTLIREPDRRGIKKATQIIGGEVDLVHYDSDKSWQGRRYGFPLLWDALKSRGLFISDDIQDNLFFRDFVTEKSVPFAVTFSEGKFVGVALKQ